MEEPVLKEAMPAHQVACHLREIPIVTRTLAQY
jgi:hypothetical protein